MVQRKVPNKLGIQANSLKTEKRQTHNIKSSLQSHDGKSKGADLKAKKMKKSGSIKRSELEVSVRASPKTRQPPQQPGKPPPLLTQAQAKTPSPKKPSPCKSLYASPNYMKSTSSSEARKEPKKVSISSSSIFHKVTKSLNRVSSLKKVRTLTKVPSFKHTRTGGKKCSKVVLCENLDAQRATCSSTLKDSKFPPFLTLAPGATEAEGTSTMKVCPYNYCSLNGHHHTPAPPLKLFLSSRRRVLKTQKVARPEILSPRKVKPSESSISMMPENHNEEFFVEIYARGREVAAAIEDVTMEPDPDQVSESLSEEPFSTDFQDGLDQSEATVSINMTVRPEDEPLAPVQDQLSSQCSYNGSDLEVDSSTSISLDEFFGENSDMEWEEGQISAAYLDNKGNISAKGDNGNDQDEPDTKPDDSVSSYLMELLAEKLTSYCHEEITEWQRFSDVDSVSVPDSESTQPDDEQIEELLMKEDNNKINTVEVDEDLEVKSNEEQDNFSSEPIDDITDVENEDLDSNQGPAEPEGDEAQKDNYSSEEIREENDAGIVMDETETADNTNKDALPKIEDGETSSTMTETSESDINNQAEFDQMKEGNDTDASFSIFADCQQPDDGNFPPLDVAKDGSIEEQNQNEANKFVIANSTSTVEQNYSSIVKLHSNENPVLAVEALEEELSKTAELDASPVIRSKTGQTKDGVFSRRGTSSNEEFLDRCNKLKRSTRCKKAEEESEEIREFNPRGPNFLPIVPDPEAEKVDLRHQEVDERRNAEEWMVDFALRKAVNQLAPAQKKKVALLVEAFETVAPTSKCEPHQRRSSSAFAHARPIQACR